MLIYFGIGTNLGDREANLRTALQLLHDRVGECIACSSIYRSAPQGFASENEFANMVVVCRTDHSPEEVLLITQQIEREMGRTEKSVNGVYHDRVIDIDLLQAGIGSRESKLWWNVKPIRSRSLIRVCTSATLCLSLSAR